MQWSSEKNAGFSEGDSWIGVNPDYPAINVSESISRGDSLFSFYRKLLRFRKNESAIARGDIEFVDTGVREFCLYRRTLCETGESCNIVVWVGANLSPCRLTLKQAGPWTKSALTSLANYGPVVRPEVWLPWELRVWYER